MEGAHPALTVVLALAVGIFAQSVARHLRLPGIVLLLFSGAALGPDGLGWVQPRSLGDGLFAIVDLAVAVILFEGGLNLEIRRLRRSQAPIRRLVTWGAVLTLMGAAVVAHALLGWPWTQSVLFGGLVVVTGPTVVGPIVRDLRLRPRVATVLEAEGVMIDPVGAILAVLLLELTLAPGAESVANETTNLLFRLGFGAASGVGAGFALAFLLRVRRLVPEGHENIFVLAAVLLLFQGCDEVVSHSGILAVTVAGVVVGNLRTLVDRDLREFKDQLSILLIGLLFVLLAADVRLADVQKLGMNGLLVVAGLVLLVRPIGVWLSTLGSDLDWRERVLLAWVAPRGIVAAAVASVAAVALDRQHIPGGAEVRALVFLTIAVTVVLAGLTAGPVAALLDQRLPSRDTIAILGAQGLGFLLGCELRDAGEPVIFLDSNPENCRRAEESGIAVVYGDALQERTMQRARFERVRDVVGATANQMLNSVFVSRARERFGVSEGYVAVDRPESGLAPELVENEKAVVLFDGPHDAARWEVRERHDDLAVEQWVWGGAASTEENPVNDDPGFAAEHFVILMVRRNERALVMHQRIELEAGDVASIVVYQGERTDARLTLARLGWSPAGSDEADAPAAG
ncbi:MAG: cation:proton antiporter [Myxococcota bacterium]